MEPKKMGPEDIAEVRRLAGKTVKRLFALEAVVAALPRCWCCPRVATQHGWAFGQSAFCDEHARAAEPNMAPGTGLILEFTYADALRALAKAAPP